MEEELVPVAASSGGAAPATSSWSSSTNWTVRRGSLKDTICFETSASILEDGGVDDGAVSVPGGLLLTRPGVHQESDPCEINLCFREKHEIHRIYVRSTARVYEIYYASEMLDRDNEYLCTVRCGATGKEAFIPRCDSGEADVRLSKDFNASNEVHKKLIKSESNIISEEDGWVDVMVPDSPLLGDGSNACSNNQDGAIGSSSQIYHEATAEISDASPCTNLKLRLLSLQSKERVHIEEIYIYADPVESDDSGPPLSMGGNTTGNSLLAMLVPGVLQLSKAQNSKMQDRTVSDYPSVQTHAIDASIKTEEIVPEITRGGMQKKCSTVLQKEPALAPLVDEIITPSNADEELRVHHVLESIPEKGNATSGHLEKTLEELVLRVGRIESFLSRFEENMLKPLSCIDTRLQQVEQQLETLSLRTASSKPFQCSKISAPEFQFDECDSDGAIDISSVAKEEASVNSPDVIKEDAAVSYLAEEDATAGAQNLVEDMPASSPVLPAADGSASVVSSVICPGLFIKAPEFFNEEDEHLSSNDVAESTIVPCSKAKGSLSIDDALSSALNAFLLSASMESTKNDIASVPESLSSNDAVDNLRSHDNLVACETVEVSGNIFNETRGVFNVYVGSGPDITYHEGGEGQGAFHEKWPLGNSEGLSIEEDSCNNQCHVRRDDASEIDENEIRKRWTGDVNDTEEIPSEVPSLKRAFRNWIEDSSSDSDIDESITEIHHSTNWLDENSSDSETESSTLCNWLYGRQDDHRFRGFTGAMTDNHPYSGVSDVSVRCDEDKSHVEIQKTFNSSRDGELMSDIQRVLDSLSNDKSSLLDVQFVRHENFNYGFPLDSLIMGTGDCQIDVCGNNRLDHITPRQECSSRFSVIAQGGAPVAVDNLLVDLEGVAMENGVSHVEGSNDQPLFSSLI